MKTPSNQTRVRKEKPVIIYNLSVNNYCSLNHFLSYDQFLVAWILHSCTAKGRSPGWSFKRFYFTFPVSQWSQNKSSRNTVTSSYRILTCFPFHQSRFPMSFPCSFIIRTLSSIWLTPHASVLKLYVTTGSFYHTYTNASRNVINWRIWPHFRLWFPQQKWYNIPQRQNL